MLRGSVAIAVKSYPRNRRRSPAATNARSKKAQSKSLNPKSRFGRPEDGADTRAFRNRTRMRGLLQQPGRRGRRVGWRCGRKFGPRAFPSVAAMEFVRCRNRQRSNRKNRNTERFPAKRMPVRVKKTRRTGNPVARSDSIETEKAPSRRPARPLFRLRRRASIRTSFTWRWPWAGSRSASPNSPP